jgi:hypothetical protein
MVLEYESQHLPQKSTSHVGFYIPAPWVAYGIWMDMGLMVTCFFLA